MAAARASGKLYPLFTLSRDNGVLRFGGLIMAYLATAIFVGLYGFGQAYFGWADSDGKVSMALFTCFLLGAVAGYKAKA